MRKNLFKRRVLFIVVFVATLSVYLIVATGQIPVLFEAQATARTSIKISLEKSYYN